MNNSNRNYSNNKTNQNDNDNNNINTIKVYDKVLSQKSCQLLHEAAAQGGLGHKVFERRRSQQRNYETTTTSRHDDENNKDTTNNNTNTNIRSRKHNKLKQPSVVDTTLEDAHQLLRVYQKKAQEVKNEKRCIIEEALEAILTELEDHDQNNASNTSNNSNNSNDMKRRQYVEYWTRQEWRHIEAHADVDEHRAKEDDRRTTINEDDDDDQPPQQDAATATASYRYPLQGHVLYLQVGTNVRGPTCVFPNIQTGGELLSASVPQDDDDNDNKDDNADTVSKKHHKTSVPALVVPAVEGRVLQFPGNLLHTVPRPTDLWYVSFVMGGAAYQPADLWGRSVILFNTWYDTPPHNVPLTITPTVTNPNSNVVNKKKDWKQVFQYSSGLVPSVASSFEETKDIEIAEQQRELNNYPEDTNVRENDEQQQQQQTQQHEEEEEDSMSNVKIWLLGNERRRDHVLRTVNLQAKTSSKDAFLESHRVSMIELEQR